MAPGAGDTTTRLLDAALSTIERHGVARFTMEDVGRSAGLTRQTVYRYFPSRPALIDAVVERREQLLLKGLEAEFTEADTLADAFASGGPDGAGNPPLRPPARPAAG